MTRCLPLSVTLLVAACGAAPPRAVTEHVDGAPVDDPGPAVAALVLRRATRDLGCAAVSIDEASTGSVYRASGCDRKALYVVVRSLGDQQVFARPTGVPVDVTYDVLPLSDTPPDAVPRGGPWDRNVWGWPLPPSIAVALDAQGAEALACPRADVVPHRIPSKRAEKRLRAFGCGKVAEFDAWGKGGALPALRGPPVVLPAPYITTWRPWIGSLADAGANAAAP
jgi:hypothetical protein